MEKNIKLFYWYKALEDEFIKEYAGKYLLIGPDRDATPYNDLETAYDKGCERYGYGNFIVPQCVPDGSTMSYSPVGHYLHVSN